MDELSDLGSIPSGGTEEGSASISSVSRCYNCGKIISLDSTIDSSCKNSRTIFPKLKLSVKISIADQNADILKNFQCSTKTFQRNCR